MISEITTSRCLIDPSGSGSLSYSRSLTSAYLWKPRKMEFFYLFLTLLVIYYVSDFWRARRSKQPWLLKKLNPLGERTGETVWTDWLESPQRETPLLTPRERKEQHTQHREAEAASKNQRNEEIFRAYESILRESLAATHSLDFNTLYDYVPLPISSVPADLVQAALPP